MAEGRPSEITASHVGRRALIYCRQSSRRQVEENRWSAEYQRGQVRYAEPWWPRAAIEVIDEDLGRSGTATDHRSGYQRMVAEIKADLAGAIFVSDLTRAGREIVDELILLNECLAHDVLVVVDGRFYDMRDSGHLLMTQLCALLGQHENRERAKHSLHGRLAKLRAGKSVSSPPAGYVRDKDGSWYLDPNPDVQAAIRAVFSAYLDLRSLRKVVMKLRRDGVLVPRRPTKTDLVWAQPSIKNILKILKNIHYSGTYTYFVMKTDYTAERSKSGRRQQRPARPDQVVTIRNHHDPYVSPETWEEIQAILRAHASTYFHTSLGPGKMLLQGLVRCAVHGLHLLRAESTLGGRFMYYRCLGDANHAERFHGAISARQLETEVVKAVFEHLSPPSLKVLRAAFEEARGEYLSGLRMGERHVEIARQKVNRLRYRYERVDPDNRLVAAEIEKELNSALIELSALEVRAKIQRQQADNPYDDSVFDALSAIAGDIPKLFWADTTEDAERKEILRAAIRWIIVEDMGEEIVRARIVWISGLPDTPVQIKRFAWYRSTIRSMAAEGMGSKEIADELNARGERNRQGRLWTHESVSDILSGKNFGKRKRARERALNAAGDSVGDNPTSPRREAEADRSCARSEGDQNVAR